MDAPDAGWQPHNIDAEQVLIGSAMVNNTVVAAVAQRIRASQFYDPIHRRIWELIVAQVEEGRVATPVSLQPALRDLDLNGMTAAQYLAQCATGALPPAFAVNYAADIADLSDRRELILMGEQQSAAARDLGMSIDETGGKIVTVIDEMRARRIRNATPRVTLGAAVTAALDASDANATAGPDGAGMAFGLRDLDDMLGGLKKGQLAILAARPSMGKSAVACSLSVRAARRGFPVLYFSLEMSDVELAERAISDMAYLRGARVEYRDINQGKIHANDRAAVDRAASELAELPFIIDPQGGLTVAEIAARTNRVIADLERAGTPLRMIVIDHLHKITPTDRYGKNANRNADFSDISAGLATLAKNTGIPMLVLAQLSRAVESRVDKRPVLSDLRESGAIEQDADIVMFVYREAYYLKEAKGSDVDSDAIGALLAACSNEMDIIIGKQRQGPTGSVKLFCNLAYNHVSDLAKG